MYVPNFNFHFTLKSSVQKEAMQAKTNKQKAQKNKQKNYNDSGKQHTSASKPLLMCNHFLQVYYDNGVLKAGAGKDKIPMLVINI